MKLGLAAVVAAASAFGACLSTPPFTPTVLVSYTDVKGFDASINGNGFLLHFGDGGFRFPDALKINDSTNLLGPAAGSRCYEQSGAGLALRPTPRISADTIAPLVQNELVPLKQGPAVAQVQLNWATRFDCSHTRAPHGSSTFTAFPDGRIVRHDTLSDPSSDPTSASDCMCESDPLDEFLISSYWTFVRSFQSLSSVSDGEASPARSLPTAQDPPANDPAICLDGASYQVASLQVAPMVPPGDTPDSTTVFATNSLIGHRIEQPLGAAALKDLSWDIQSVLFIDPTAGGCTDAAKRVAAYTDPPKVTIDGTVVTFSPFDGIYGSDLRGDESNSGILLPGGHGTLQADAAPFAVWLRFPDPIDSVYATAQDESGPWYTPQRVNDRSWIVWVSDPLAAGKPIQIGPL